MATTSDDLGEVGEQLARGILGKLFEDVYRVERGFDHGIDFVCKTLRSFPCDDVGPYFQVQVKTGSSYRNGIYVHRPTFTRWVQGVADAPVVVLHLDDVLSRRPHVCFRVLHEWTRTTGRAAYHSATFRHRDFVDITDGRSELGQALEEEARRANRSPGALFATNTHDQSRPFRELLYLCDLQFLVNLGDIGKKTLTRLRHELHVASIDELCWAVSEAINRREIPEALAAQLKRRYAVADVLSPMEMGTDVRPFQIAFYRAIELHSRGRPFQLPRFKVAAVRTWRLLASEYPAAAAKLASHVLRYSRRGVWTDQKCDEILVALEIAADLASCGDQLIERDMTELLRDCAVAARLVTVGDLESYRLKHHMLQAAAAATGSRHFSERAVEVTRRAPQYERHHLGLYGWPLDAEVVARYQGRLRDDSVRGLKLKPYHERMLEIAGELFG